MKIIIARTIKGDIWSHGIAKILKTNDADPIYWEFQLFFFSSGHHFNFQFFFQCGNRPGGNSALLCKRRTKRDAEL